MVILSSNPCTAIHAHRLGTRLCITAICFTISMNSLSHGRLVLCKIALQRNLLFLINKKISCYLISSTVLGYLTIVKLMISDQNTRPWWCLPPLKTLFFKHQIKKKIKQIGLRWERISPLAKIERKQKRWAQKKRVSGFEGFQTVVTLSMLWYSVALHALDTMTLQKIKTEKNSSLNNSVSASPSY